MKTIDKKVELMERIIFLENKQSHELQLLKEQFQVTYESIKPLNLIKNTLHEVVSSSDIRKDLFNGVINLTTGYVTKKLFMDSKDSPVKNVLQTAMKFVLKNFVGKKQEHSNNLN